MSDAAPPMSTSTNWSVTQWADWLNDKIATHEHTFVNEPSEMIAARNREIKDTQQYHGRELLELLQNADDAGVNYGPNKVLIYLTAQGVCIANTGIPFSDDGVVDDQRP